MGDRSRNSLLAISLALNVFILGAVAGGAYMWHALDPAKVAENQRALRFAAQALPPAQRMGFRQALAAARRAAASDIETARQGRDALARLLSQDALDQAAIDAELTKIRSADMALRTRLEQAIIDFAESLTPAQRREFVDGLRQRGGILRQVPAKKTDPRRRIASFYPVQTPVHSKTHVGERQRWVAGPRSLTR
ncbi:MAG: periplasmic heavy metal sensor [Hyphomicrobiaceae bacterium]